MARIHFTCDRCQTKAAGEADHYDRFRCPHCDHAYWALRPQRNGPLVAFPWPGTPAMLRYKHQSHAAPSPQSEI